MIRVRQAIDSLTYTNAPFVADAFDPTKNYVTNDLVRYGARIYKSITGIAPNYNVGNYPLSSLKEHWFDWQPSNAYAMLDDYHETLTEWAGDGIIEFTRSGKNTIGIGNFTATQVKIEYLDAINGIVEGMTIATSIDLDSTVTAGYAYVDLARVDLDNTLKSFTASKDTYVDIDSTGTLVYTEVANGAAEPALTIPNERLAKVVTDVVSITSVTDLRTIINPVLDTDTYNFPTYMCKINFWQYITCGFNTTNRRVIYQNLKRLGTYIRVTFSNGGGDTNCGYCIAGMAIDCGITLDKVSFPDRRIGSRTINVANFNTILDKNLIMDTAAEAKAVANIPMLFVIDPSTDLNFNNMAIIGTILKCDSVAENATKNQLSWELQQNVIL